MFHVKLWNFPVAGDSVETRNDTPHERVVGVRRGRL